MERPAESKPEGIAVIGMACRFPGARTLAEYWENLHHGRESISFFSDTELLESGVERSVFTSPQYVKAAPVLDDVDLFDAEFFRCSPKEAALMDPQQRLFLQCAWEALEDAGYDPLHVPQRTGVYAGALVNTYLLHNIAAGRMSLSFDSSDFLETLIASDKDFLATRTSFKLNLKGPSVTVQTACSTGLVAIHLACQSLLNGECETALAGAASVRFPHRAGYMHRAGGMVSPDGHCRPFSHRSEGTVFGSGVGIVVLKRLADAIDAGDSIHAVIRGTAVNNDGASKMSYTAPGIEGHAEVVAEALAMAGLDAGTIGYVEAHGTATDLGDPVEIAALSQAYRSSTGLKQFCAVGSVKGNIGHLDTAAGIAGFIKTVLVLKHGSIPATLHFERPNPKIDFAASPFYVNSSNVLWQPGVGPRRAGISSLGVGGTNAHAILEQAPETHSADESVGDAHLLVLSARTATALQAQVSRYRAHFLSNPHANFGDACYTAATGRHAFDRRAAVLVRTATEAAEQLARIPIAGKHATQSPRIAFLFSGQGSQYPGMAQHLYREYPVFRNSMDAAQDLLRPWIDPPLLEIISRTGDRGLLDRTIYTQPAVLAIDLALYDLWRSWGIAPAIVMGHSLGQYAAAAVAGVFTREDAFRIVCERAQMMQSLPDDGAMAAIRAPAEQTLALIAHIPEVETAALNAPDEVVISGRRDAVLTAIRKLEAHGAATKLLPVSHAFHSSLMDPILDRLERAISAMKLSAPSLPIVSNLTGRLVGDEMTDPAYWREHARQPVRFADGMRTLWGEGCRVFLEAGPGAALLGFGAGCFPRDAEWLPSIRKQADEQRTILESLGRLYSLGVNVDWNGFYQGKNYRRVSLPAYPFEGKRHWVSGGLNPPNRLDLYELQWRTRPLPATAKPPASIVMTGDANGFSSRLLAALQSLGSEATILAAESIPSFCKQHIGTTVVYLSALDIPHADADRMEEVLCEAAALASDLAECSGGTSFRIVTRGSQSTRKTDPQGGIFQSGLWGLARGLAVEHPGIWAGIVDLDNSADAPEMLAREILSGGEAADQIAYRGKERLACLLVKCAAALPLKSNAIDPDGTYLITGGTGGVGQAVAKWLTDRGARHLVLTSRSGISSHPIDAADSAGMRNLLASIESTGRPLRGVFHLAGVMHYQSAKDTMAFTVKEILQPKTRGAWVLHELTQDLKLDFFIMFSSMASILPGVEMSAYAASNAFLDSLAHYRRSLGLPALSVNWGPWSGRGMGEHHSSTRIRSGVALLEPGPALESLASLMNADAVQAMVANLDWPVFHPLYESLGKCPVLDEVYQAAPRVSGGEPTEIARLRAAPPSQQRGLLERYVRAQVLSILGIDPRAGIVAGKRLFELGLDSLGAIKLRNQLQSGLEKPLPATLTLNYPTIEAITGYLAKTLSLQQKANANTTGGWHT